MSTLTAQAPSEQLGEEPFLREGARVSEATYWLKYYEYSDLAYEWNDGRLEEKPVSDHLNGLVHGWFVEVLGHYLKVHPIAATVGLEFGFRLPLPTKTVIRKPDLGVVRHDNPVRLKLADRTFGGVFDLCVETLSDSTRAEAERDTVRKKEEYEDGGVKEYYILHSGPRRAFYTLGPQGVFVPIVPDAAGVVHSVALPGFRFRPADLDRRPTLQKMTEDPVYQGFVLPDYQALRSRAARLAAKLQALGIDPDGV